MKINVQLTWAYNPYLKRIVNIDDDNHQNTNNCICLKCKEPLIAKNNIPKEKMKRSHHFAHNKDSKCEGSYETMVHELSKQIIADNKRIYVPEYKGFPARIIKFNSVEIEERNDISSLQPDCVGVTENGIRYAIEIFNTHKVDYIKKEKLEKSKLNCLEINVTNKNLEELEDFLLNSSKDREWITYPSYKKLYTESIVRFWLENKKALLPEYKRVMGEHEIIFDEIHIVEKHEDYIHAIGVKDENKINIINLLSDIRLQSLDFTKNDIVLIIDDKEMNNHKNILNPSKVYWWQNSVYEYAIMQSTVYNICKTKEILLPQYKDSTSLKAKKIKFDDITVVSKDAQKIEFKAYNKEKDLTIYIVVLNGIELSQNEKKKFIEKEDICLTIDIKSFHRDYIKKEMFFTHNYIMSNLTWINNPKYEEYYKNKRKKLLEKWGKQCKENNCILKEHSICKSCNNSSKIEQYIKETLKTYPQRVNSAKNMGIDIESLSYNELCNGTINFFSDKDIVIFRNKEFHVNHDVYNLFSSLLNYRNKASQIEDCPFCKSIYKEEGLDFVACQALKNDILN